VVAVVFTHPDFMDLSCDPLDAPCLAETNRD
jgi:hypothetical protein